jgi:hypothetical protein
VTRTRPDARAAGTLAALAFSAGTAGAGTIFLNEVTVQGTETVELFNSGADSVDVNGWTLRDDGAWLIQGAPKVPPEGYVVLETPGDVFGDQGGYIELLFGEPQDGVRFGQSGSAPLPPAQTFLRAGGGTSLARAPDGSNYSSPPPNGAATDGDIWTLDLTPTFGSANDAPDPALGASLLLNELDPKPVGGGDTVELYNPSALGVSLTGWFLCNGDAFLGLSGSVPGGGHVAILTPAGFDVETNEVLYLFRDDEVRVDQIGLHLPPVAARGMPTLDFCQCFARFPDGSGPSNGWDWFSSGGGSTLFALLCTPGAANEYEPSCAVTGVDAPEYETWGRVKARWR